MIFKNKFKYIIRNKVLKNDLRCFFDKSNDMKDNLYQPQKHFP